MADLIPIRRYVDADNSCLFSSFGYLVEKNKFSDMTSLKIRQAVVNAILSEKKYDITILGQPKEAYIDFIQNPSSWGGATELKILSDLYQIQIVAIDVKSMKHYIFGEDNKFPKRIYVVHNGVHYDPLVMTISSDANNDNDITIFNSKDDIVFAKFKSLVKNYHDQGEYVDLSDLKTLECDDCKELKGLVDKFQCHRHTFTCKKKGKIIKILPGEGHGREGVQRLPGQRWQKFKKNSTE